ncbi:MAG: SDR family NAD(P)-dependent oxidoreductase [Candidatus Aminicenantes bacterium]|nr:SDR family NAD(P)-dependent oxidoreductase [Candidatus Aminicenantes bacterium]
MTRHKKKTCTLITGASSGLGKCFAEECAKRGMNLILVALPDHNLAHTTEYIQNKYQVSVVPMGIDLSEKQAPEKIYSVCQQKGLIVNALINNAGLTGCISFEDSPLLYSDLRIQLNMRALVLLCRVFIPSMKKLESAYILNVCSLAAFFAIPFKSVYSASKAFVLNFSKALREELKDSSVQVSILCPSGIKTNTHSNQRISTHGAKGNLFLITPEKIAETGIKNMLRGKKIIVPGFSNRLLLFLNRILPEKIKQNLLYNEFKKELGVCEKEIE